MKDKKAEGQDGMTNETWKIGCEEVLGDLHKVINGIWRRGGMSREWKEGVITPIFKKGNRDEVKNYRGITRMDSEYKIYAEILKRRLEEEVKGKEKLNDTQTGFRKGRGTTEAIFALKTAINVGTKKKGGKIFVGFAVLKAAFDRVIRKKIWEAMEKMGISENLRRRIEEIYEETFCLIRIRGRMVGKFKTSKGVRQGCPLCALLFNIVMAKWRMN